MKDFIADVVELLSIFAFSTALSIARFDICLAFSGIEFGDFVISVISPICNCPSHKEKGRRRREGSLKI